MWLCAERPTFSRSDFFTGRTVYYPGSGFDGDPVKLCSRAHAAHAFVYADYGVEWPEIARQIADPETGFRGYAIEREEPVAEAALRPGGWVAHATVKPEAYGFASARPFARLVVLRREDTYDDTYGLRRFAVLFVGGDGFATFDALYCQGDGTPAPYLVASKDHGFGGNYDCFGAGGLLERLAVHAAERPRYLLVYDRAPWAGYGNTGAEPYGGWSLFERLPGTSE